MTEQDARKKLRELQDLYGDTFDSNITIRIGNLWIQGREITINRLGGDFTLLMNKITQEVEFFVYGRSTY